MQNKKLENVYKTAIGKKIPLAQGLWFFGVY